MSSENGRLVERDPQDTGRHSLQSVGEISLSQPLYNSYYYTQTFTFHYWRFMKRDFAPAMSFPLSLPHLLVSGGGDVLGKLRRRLGGAGHLRVRQQQLVVSRLQKIQQRIGLP